MQTLVEIEVLKRDCSKRRTVNSGLLSLTSENEPSILSFLCTHPNMTHFPNKVFPEGPDASLAELFVTLG